MALAKNKKRSAFKLPVRGKAGFTLTELAFVAVIVMISIAILYPFIEQVRRKSQILACEENLEKIGMGLKLYAGDHQGKFPSDLNELMGGGYIVEDERIFDCPSSPRAGSAKDPDYNYTTGYTASSPSEAVIVCDKDGNHKAGRHVLYINGDIVWETK